MAPLTLAGMPEPSTSAPTPWISLPSGTADKLSVLGTPDDFSGSGAPPVTELVLLTTANLFCLVAMYWRSSIPILRRLPEQLMAVFVGACLGLVADAINYEKLTEDVTFGFSGVFFEFFLPAIIFSNAYSVKHKSFFRNLSGILTFSLLGTIMSSLLIGYGVFWAYRSGLVRGGNISVHTEKASHGNEEQMPLVDCLILGSMMSAVDPGAVLSVLPSNVDRQLYSLLFGESVLNSAIAIVLYNGFRLYHNTLVARGDEDVDDITWADIRLLVTRFVVITLISMAVGIAVGLLSAFILKHAVLQASPGKEQAVLFLFAYLSYLLPRQAGLSPVVSLFLCGATMAHYTFYNISHMSQVATATWFKSIGHVAETFVFVFIGAALAEVRESEWRPDLAGVLIVLCVVSRFIHIFTLGSLVNLSKWLIAKVRSQPIVAYISWETQFLISWSGLRGAVAFALALHAPVLNQEGLMLTTTVAVVLFTYIVMGGSVFFLAEYLGMASDETDQLRFHDRQRSRILSQMRSPSAIMHYGASPHTAFLNQTQIYDRGLSEEEEEMLANAAVEGGGGYGTFTMAWRTFDERIMKPVFGGSFREAHVPAANHFKRPTLEELGLRGSTDHVLVSTNDQLDDDSEPAGFGSLDNGHANGNPFA
mmetsp:Transcript_21635/g.42494  ORF Transcript_21635/g.42494 Transcript_21635/m.42494 type:complete len:648 (+) Transcript_21635:115-2058(+)|eukprot:CAMPEP_0171543212 /NCGR_PEP_ID=MMETSP0960-20121227/2804_1 /TAXON_ID=87120 /ORGANISM="Aurantiochytrium limacinum, Strain ATCCMYA-1381" /LENGTH=647 /DNA_ID=CAMNT_0012090853 /DNA_START=15 /DNA_END=1958 /DNA_ORIENTATION=-